MGFQKSSAAKKAEKYADNAEKEVQRLYSTNDPNTGLTIAMDVDVGNSDGIVNPASGSGGSGSVGGHSDGSQKILGIDVSDEDISDSIPASTAASFEKATGVSVKDFVEKSLNGDLSADQLAQAVMAKAAPSQASSLSNEYASLAKKLGDQKLDPSKLSLEKSGALSYGGALDTGSSSGFDLQSTIKGFFGDDEKKNSAAADSQSFRKPASMASQNQSGVSSLFSNVSKKYRLKLKEKNLPLLPWASPYNRGVTR